MEQRPIDDVFLEGIKKQIEAASLTIAQALHARHDIELRIDFYGHLNVISVNKHKLQIKPF